MTVPSQYLNHKVPVKYFLASYRALSDGRSGIRDLEEKLHNTKVFLSEWKVVWIGTCAILRTAIALFQVDAESCLVAGIREEIASEWNAIKADREQHAIFWNFLRQERDNIVHQYQWRAYESWMKPDGTFRGPNLSLLIMENDDDARPALMMNGGPYQGQNSLDLLKESAEWVEDRIFAAIRRAGFDPDEQRSLGSFIPLVKSEGGLLNAPTEDEATDQ